MNRRGRPPRTRPPVGPQTLELDILSLGARGDGVAQWQGQTVFVSLAVPGDRVVARVTGRRGDGLAAELVELLDPGPGRATPACGHFGSCGGCGLQHLGDAGYGEWKRGLLLEPFRRAGLPLGAVAPLRRVGPGTRRRAAFAFVRRRSGVVLGFNARASHQVIDLAGCPLLVPSLAALLPPLRDLLGGLGGLGGTGDAIATLTASGLDLLIDAEARLDLADRERLAAFAETRDLARLCWRSGGRLEPIACRRPPLVRFAAVPVELPPGAFLQPSREGEELLAGLVVEAAAGAGRVADLYAGCGSFSFPLAARAAVHAVEGEAPALQALLAAASRASARVTGEVRDLVRQPLAADELARFDAVVFDPPRAGAAAQAEQLAAAGPRRVVAVSCNPATLARDATVLCAGGYRLLQVTPVDQFPWSAHLEAVAVFER